MATQGGVPVHRGHGSSRRGRRWRSGHRGWSPIVGKAPANADGGAAPANTPVRMETLDDAVTNFARRQGGNVVRNALYDSLELAMLAGPAALAQGVRREGGRRRLRRRARRALEAADDVTMVSLANESSVGNAARGDNPPTGPAGAQGARGDHVGGRPAADRLRDGRPGDREEPHLRRGHGRLPANLLQEQRRAGWS